MPLAHFPGPSGYICHKCKIEYKLNVDVLMDEESGYWICKKCNEIEQRKEKLMKIENR